VDYNGRRLAKLNLPPSAVLGVLASYHQWLGAEIRQLAPQEADVLLPACRQLDACVVITLNNAFYQVREAETTVFFELGRAELESRGEEQLLARSEQVLRRYCQAQAARILFAGGWVPLPRLLARPLYLDLERCPKELLLDPDWRGRHRSAWSVPLPARGWPQGVMQFAFARQFRWLPRELQLLEAAGESCRLACVKARLVEELAAREQQVRDLAGHMLQVEEVERRRISRELHDEAGQLLLYLRLHMERLEGVASAKSPEVSSGLAGARQMIE
jgi:signal transduction histidine kinase